MGDAVGTIVEATLRFVMRRSVSSMSIMPSGIERICA